MNKIELHIFTNCESSYEQTFYMLCDTYNSFISVFDDIPVYIWCDKNPNIQNINQYINLLKTKFVNIKITTSLSDGYIQAIKNSSADYLFMLEHDWLFNARNISHSLNDITKTMRNNDLYHFRFNKRRNVPAIWDNYLKEYEDNNLFYCETNNLSNNPHIINRKFYKNKIVKFSHIKKSKKSQGIEEELLKLNLYHGHIYGKYNHPATIHHLNNKYAKFAIVIVTYNNEKYIEEAINSVLEQTYKNWELIIVDDCSTDETVTKIQSFLPHPKIKFIQNQFNMGVGASRNIGVAYVNADYFGDLDGDDVLTFDAVKVMYEAHQQYPNAGMIYSQFAHHDINMHFLHKGYCDFIPTDMTNLQANKVSHWRTYKLYYFNQTVGFEEKILKSIDKDISYKMEEVSELIFIDQILYLYRNHNQGISQGNNKQLATIAYEQVKANAIERRQNYNISIIFPYKDSNEYYKQLINWSKQYYQNIFPNAQIVIGEDTTGNNDFCRSAAINNGVKKAIFNNLILVDIDIIVQKSQLQEALLLLDHYNYIIPYNKINKLDEVSTLRILKNQNLDFPIDYNIIKEHSHPNPLLAGGVQVINKTIFNTVNGYDENFKGWGAEDYAFCSTINQKCGKGYYLQNTIIHLWHPEQPSRQDYLSNKNHPNRILYQKYVNNQISYQNIITRISYYGGYSHYNSHLKDIWKALPNEFKGNYYYDVTIKNLLNYEYLLISGGLDYFPNNNIILMNHGAGQGYINGNHSYAGGDNRNNVKLFLQPNEYAANLDRQKYPKTKQAIIGCPKLDKWHQRKLTNNIKKRNDKPVIAISFHFDCQICPETRSAWDYYKSILPMLAYKNMTQEWEVIGHGHPRMIYTLIPYYKEHGIEIVRDFEDIMERADLYIMDHMSTLYEFASTDRPVVVLNAPWYRRNVEHGLRYWEYADVGINCDHPDDLERCINLALEDPLEQKMKRERACNAVYAYRDGMCAERAAKAIVEFLENKDINMNNIEYIQEDKNVRILQEVEARQRKWFA